MMELSEKGLNSDIERLSYHTVVSLQVTILICSAKDFVSAKKALESRPLLVPIHILVA